MTTETLESEHKKKDFITDFERKLEVIDFDLYGKVCVRK